MIIGEKPDLAAVWALFTAHQSNSTDEP
ncbi:MAG: hypothetical protein UV58_C0013G0001, partial [Candidatus Wolfebacteria bacterium GW2011_GWC1_43_10]